MSDSNQGDAPGSGGTPRSPIRSAAEGVTLAVSVVIVLGVAGYLGFQAFQETSPFVPTRLQLRLDKVERAGERYVLPVDVTNQGTRTVSRFRAQVSYPSGEGQRETRDVEVQYLAEQATETAYLYFDKDPRGLELHVSPHSYQLR